MIDWNAVFLDPLEREREANMNDELVFSWTGNHNVYLMESEEKFNACDFTGATSVGDVSPATYTVTQFPAYFGCALPSHCQNGLKLKVTESTSFIKYNYNVLYASNITINVYYMFKMKYYPFRRRRACMLSSRRLSNNVYVWNGID